MEIDSEVGKGTEVTIKLPLKAKGRDKGRLSGISKLNAA